LLYPAELRNHQIFTDCKDRSFFTIPQEKQQKLSLLPGKKTSDLNNPKLSYAEKS